MLFSSTLLKKLINVQDTPENIANYLTLKTCEIEEIHTIVIPKEVVIGKVTKCVKHPDADKLSITQVDCGDKGQYQIVTGASNIQDATIVPVALPGCTLPAVELTIAPREMRGEESNGMICSKEELGIKEDLDLHGIWNLPEDFDDVSEDDLGKPLGDKYPWLESFVFDIDNKTLTNRPDLTGHWGQATELFAIYGINHPEMVAFNSVENTLKDLGNINILETLDNSEKGEQQIDIQSEACRAYSILELKDVNVAKSSFFQRLQLIQLDSLPRNNFVDFSNIFMHTWGQPIHFFDADKVEGKIIVRQAKDGEEFTDLTDKEHILTEKDLVIADEKKVIGLAGVIGGQNTAISENTKNILVEIGNFDDVMLRKTALRLDLRTDAEVRFEKNINPAWSLFNVLFFLDEFKRNTELDGKISGLVSYQNEMISSYLNKIIPMDLDKVSKFAGVKIEDEIMNKILTKTGFEIIDGNIKVPVFRGPDDINIKEDIYEEIVRIYGYENIEPQATVQKQTFKPFNQKVAFTRNIEEKMATVCGFDQVETYSWHEEKVAEKLNYNIDLDTLWSLENPVTPENKYLRNQFFLSHLKVLEKNFREFDNIKLFEIGKLYQKDYNEKMACGFALYNKKIKDWSENNIFEIKNAVETCLDAIGVKGKIDYKPYKETPNIAHPKQHGEIILNGRKIGEIFTLNPYYHQYFKFPQNAQITFAMVDLAMLMEIANQQGSKKITKFNYYTLEDQIVNRDLSFVIGKDKEYNQVTNAVSKIKEIIDLEVFDLYDVDESNKSISINIKIKGEKLTTEDINKVMDKAIDNVTKAGGKLRA